MYVHTRLSLMSAEQPTTTLLLLAYCLTLLHLLGQQATQHWLSQVVCSPLTQIIELICQAFTGLSSVGRIYTPCELMANANNAHLMQDDNSGFTAYNHASIGGNTSMIPCNH